MEFNPNNKIIKYCMMGMAMEEKGKPEAANEFFQQGWNEATNNFEKYIAAYYLAKYESNTSRRLKWFETALEFALNVNNDATDSALPALYVHIAACYEKLGAIEKARKYYDLANAAKNNPGDKGPFYHGTRADLPIGSMLNPGGKSNYKEALTMNHIYFTALANGAGLAAALAKGEGRERVYIIEPTGSFEHDPNVTDKKFPGNPSRSYRSLQPLKITGELTDWQRTTPEELERWREKLADNKGDIIN